MEMNDNWLRRHGPLLALCLALVLFRGSLLFCVESIWPSLERFYTGTVTKDLVEGLKLPLFDYQFSSYEAGWLFAAWVCLPFMKIFGFTSAGMGAAGIAIHLVPLIIFYHILDRRINRRVAVFFGIQYILSPYVFNITTLFVGFNYFNMPFFTSIFLGMYLAIFRGKDVRGLIGGPLLSVFLLGVCGGFATWTCFAFLLISVPCLVHWWIYCRTWNVKAAVSFIAGGLVGISPLFMRLAAFAGEIKLGVVDRVVKEDAAGFIARLLDFLGTEPEFAWSVFFQYMELLGVALFITLLVLRAGYFGRAVRSFLGGQSPQEEDGGAVLILVMYLLTFITVYCLSDFANERYFQPIYPFLFACNAVTVDALLRRKGRAWHRLGAGALALHLFLSVADCAAGPLYQTAPNLSLFRDRAYSYELLGCLVSWRFSRDPRRVMHIVEQMDDPGERRALMRGFGFELAVESGEGRLVGDYIQYFAENHPGNADVIRSFNTGLLLGYGQQLYEGTYLAEFYPNVLQVIRREDAIRFLKEHTYLIRFEDEDRRAGLYTGLGLQFAAVAGQVGLTAGDVKDLLDPKYTAEFLEGTRLAQKYGYNI